MEQLRKLLGESSQWDVWKCERTGDWIAGTADKLIIFGRCSADAPASHLCQILNAFENGMRVGMAGSEILREKGES